MKLTSEDLFEYWLIEMDDALRRFFASLPSVLQNQLDYSPDSLVPLEEWILSKYNRPQDLIEAEQKEMLDGLARYIGEVYRKTIGGRWEIRLDDPNYVYYGLPQLTGFAEKSTPICPHTLVTASVDRRTGTFLRTILANAEKAFIN